MVQNGLMTPHVTPRISFSIVAYRDSGSLKKREPACTTCHLSPLCCYKIKPRPLLLASVSRLFNLVGLKISRLVNLQAIAWLIQKLWCMPVPKQNRFSDSKEVVVFASCVQFFRCCSRWGKITKSSEKLINNFVSLLRDLVASKSYCSFTKLKFFFM